MKICLDMTLQNFLRAFQMHVFQYGLPSVCMSDAGSNILAGSKIISRHLEDDQTISYLNENGIKTVEFLNYAKGCEKLGGIVEICVKLVKRLIFGSIKKYTVNYSDFEYMVAEVNHLVNRRPICFQNALRDSSNESEVPVALTPEILIHGHELVSVNVIPSLEESDDWEPNVCPNNMYNKMAKIRSKLGEIYANEFLPQLIHQATNIAERYAPKKHDQLKVGDIVIIKENMTKRANMPLAMVRDLTKNSLGEVTSVKLFKGGTREIVERHTSSLIPILESLVGESEVPNEISPLSLRSNPVAKKRSKRAAAEASALKCRQLQVKGLI